MNLSSKVVFAAVTGALVALLGLVAPTTARADSTTWLPGMPGFGDMVVDEGAGKVFISPGKDGSRILVRDLNGAAVSSIPAMPGATGMVLDGTKLYVALCDQSAIAVVNTTTLAEIERISLGTLTLSGTCDLAHVGGRLWFPTSDQHANIATVTTSVAHTVVANALGHTVYEPLFPTATTPPSTLIVGTSGLSPSTWYTYNVGSHPATLATQVQTGGNLQDGAITASAAHIVAASGSPYHGQRFTLPALTPAGTYATSNYPQAAAVSADGGWVVIGRGSGARDVYVFASGSPTAVREFDLGTGLEPQSRGLRLNAASSRLYAIGTTSSSNANFALSVFDSPTTGTLQPTAPSVPPVPTAPVPGTGATAYPLTGMPKASSTVVDATTARLFIAPGSTGNAIQVRNLDGTAAGTITDTPGATSMVLSGGRLYVSLCGWNAIEVIDAATLAKVERIDLGANAMGGKCQLGLAGGRLFYTDSSSWASVYSVTVATPHVFAANVLGALRSDPTFASSPAQPGRLLVVETGISSATVEAYNVTASTVTRAATRSISAFANSITASAQGTHAATIMRDLRASDLAISTTYTGSTANSMAYSADGNWVATLASYANDGEVGIYARGDNQARRRVDVIPGSYQAYAGTLAFSPTGDRLYAVGSTTSSPATPTLYVLNAPTAPVVGHPENTAAPVVSGSAVQGSTLTCAPGTWTNAPSYAYTWQRDGVNIGSATAATYTTVLADRDKAVRCTVRATTAGGGVSALSNSISVTAPLVAPSNQTLPSVSGTLAVGSTLTCNPGVWTASPAFTFQWRRSGGAIALATNPTYVTQAADIGLAISCAVTATNGGGSATAASATVTIGSPPLNTLLPEFRVTYDNNWLCTGSEWTGAPTQLLTTWYRNGVAVPGNSMWLQLTPNDVGASLYCTVRATNAFGSTLATSGSMTAQFDPDGDPGTETPPPTTTPPGTTPPSTTPPVTAAPDVTPPASAPPSSTPPAETTPPVTPRGNEDEEGEADEGEPVPLAVGVSLKKPVRKDLLASGLKVLVTTTQDCSARLTLRIDDATARKFGYKRAMDIGSVGLRGLLADEAGTATIKLKGGFATKLKKRSAKFKATLTVRATCDDSSATVTRAVIL